MQEIMSNKQKKTWTSWRPYLRNYSKMNGGICYTVTIILLLLMSVWNLNVSAQEYLNPQTDLHSYKLKYTKLLEGTIPTSVDTFYIDYSVFSFQWTITGKLVSFDDQAEPIAYAAAFQTDSLFVEIDNNLVTYWTDSTAQYLTRHIRLSPGEWQVQLSASRWDSTNNVPVWSKYSNAQCFRVVKKYLPFDVPVFFKIKFE